MKALVEAWRHGEPLKKLFNGEKENSDDSTRTGRVARRSSSARNSRIAAAVAVRCTSQAHGGHVAQGDFTFASVHRGRSPFECCLFPEFEFVLDLLPLSLEVSAGMLASIGFVITPRFPTRTRVRLAALDRFLGGSGPSPSARSQNMNG